MITDEGDQDFLLSTEERLRRHALTSKSPTNEEIGAKIKEVFGEETEIVFGVAGSSPLASHDEDPFYEEAKTLEWSFSELDDSDDIWQVEAKIMMRNRLLLETQTNELFSCLSPVENQVIRLYRGLPTLADPISISQVAREIGRPRSSTWYIKERALRKLEDPRNWPVESWWPNTDQDLLWPLKGLIYPLSKQIEDILR